MKKLVLFLFFVLSVSTCFAKDKEVKTCAIIYTDHFENMHGLGDNTFLSLQYSTEEILTQRKDLRVIDRSKVESILKEQAFQQSDWSDSNKSAEMGHALNASLVIFVDYYESFYVVSFLDINTFEKTTFIRDVGKKGSFEDIQKLKKLKINNHEGGLFSWFRWWMLLVLLLVIILICCIDW